MPFKFEGKEMYLIIVFANFWTIHSWQESAQQTKKIHFHTNSAVSCQVYLHVLLFQHL